MKRHIFPTEAFYDRFGHIDPPIGQPKRILHDPEILIDHHDSSIENVCDGIQFFIDQRVMGFF